MIRLDLVVGPNGAGKSTFVRYTLAHALPGGVPFINADVIAAQRWPESQQEHAYDAAQVAADTRAAMIAARHPFIAETVFSHPSKVELVSEAQAAGFTVVMHVLMVPEGLSVARVEHRVRAGGHAVPEDKIRQRHRRLWPLVAEAAQHADSTVFYDGSAISGPRIVARLSSGVAIGRVAWPTWTGEPLPQIWPGTEEPTSRT